MNEIAITGAGAISPAGAGLAGLTAHFPGEPSRIPSIRNPGHGFPAFRAAAEPLDRWRREPRLRRASPITHLMVEAASQALGGRRPERLALVGAFFSGACHYSRLFFEPVVREGPSFASPALFPDTVYNSSLSHLAHVLGVDGASYAVIGDDCAWTSALQVASAWLELDEADHVLVVGAEELDAVTIEAYASAGWMRGDFVPGEGAAAVLLARTGPPALARLTRVHDGIPHRSRASARAAVREIFSWLGPTPALATAGNTWMKPLEAEGEARNPLVRPDLPAMGHAFTATAGWNTLRAIDWLRRPNAGERMAVPVWGLHDRVSALELARPTGPPLAVPDQSG